MINFEKIHHFSRPYDIYNRYLRFCHNYLYYKKVHVVGRENIPARGIPTFVISNHQNGLMDALAILYLFDDYRQPVYIARGDIFKKDFVARILRFLKIMPTFRSRDGGRRDIQQNNVTFQIAANVLNSGGTLAIFPEAGHQAGHFLSTFKKGFPRIAFKAEELSNFELNLQILPLNIHYSNYFNFRSELLVTVGKPFTIDEYFELYKKEQNQAYLELNNKARAIVKSLMLDIENKTYRLEFEQLLQLYHTPLKTLKKKEENYLYTQLQEDIHIVSQLSQLEEENHQLFKKLMNKTRIYRKGVEKLQFRDWLINNEEIDIFYLVKKGLFLLFFFPLFLFGFLHNIIPFSLPNLLKRKIKDPMLHSSLHFAVSVLISFPVFYLLIFIISLCCTNSLIFSV
ncbi:MAG TPA: 1-acyl-sn-glycerol-3-phosphate acyltransferase, partial [Bacteroidales bacterium]|nr:1-acyl-sn-glycerol-3-phosphate acyltransferase [Bacteroidales bacterium]